MAGRSRVGAAIDLSMRLLWIVPPLTLIMAAVRLWANRYPVGHDAVVHVNAASALAYLIRHQPGQALLFARTNLVHWPPLVHLVTTLFIFIRPGAWAYQATTLLFAALSFVFFMLLARRAAAHHEDALLATLAVAACPQWITIAVSYNLECAAAFAVIFIFWVVVSGRSERSLAASVLFGLAGGIALLAKPVAIPMALSAAVWELARNGRQDGPRLIRKLLFFGCVFLPSALWYGAYAGLFWTEVAYDGLGKLNPGTRPWWHYLRALFTKFGGTPFYVAIAVGIPFVKKREFPAPAGLLMFAAAVSLAFFSAFATKQPFYLLPAYALFTVGAVVAVSPGDRPFARAVRRACLAAYAALAVIMWIPSQARAVTLLSLGSAAPPRLSVSMESRRVAEFNMRRLAQIAASRPTCTLCGLDVTGRGQFVLTEIALAEFDPRFALARGALSYGVHDALPEILNSCYLVAVERPDARGPSSEALATNSEHAIPAEIADELASTLRRVAAAWTPAARWPAAGEDLIVAVYRNDAMLDLVPAATEPQSAIARKYLDDPGRVSREILMLLDAGRLAEARARAVLLQQTYPDEIAGFRDELVVLARWPSRAEETARLLELLRAAPPVPALFEQLVDRLCASARDGALPASEMPSLDQAVDRLPPDDPARPSLVQKIFACRLAMAGAPAARTYARGRLAAIAETQRTAVIWAFANTADGNGSPDLAAEFFAEALARADLPPGNVAFAKLRLAEINRTDLADALSAADLSDPAAAAAAARLLCERSAVLRRAGRSDEALRLLDAFGPPLAQCPICRDEIVLERARLLLQKGDNEAAIRLLNSIRADAELRQIAESLIAAGARGR